MIDETMVINCSCGLHGSPACLAEFCHVFSIIFNGEAASLQRL